MRALILLAVLALVACDSDMFDPRARVPVEENVYWVDGLEGCPALDAGGNPVAACAVYTDDLLGKPVPGTDCTMYIPAGLYAYALCHELRHCKEGDWHKGRSVPFTEC